MSPLSNKHGSTCCATPAPIARPHAPRMRNGGALEHLATAPLLPPTITPPSPVCPATRSPGGPLRARAAAPSAKHLGTHCRYDPPPQPTEKTKVCAPGARRALTPGRTQMAGTAWGSLDQNVFPEYDAVVWRPVVKAALSTPPLTGRLFLSAWTDGRSRRLCVSATSWSDSDPNGLPGSHRGTSRTHRKSPHEHDGSLGGLGRRPLLGA